MTHSRAPTILLVDDEANIIDALGLGLQRGIPEARVLKAYDGTTALGILERELIDVIISDNKMPGMSGIEFLIEARRRWPATTRMMLTAHPEEKLLERNVNEARVRYFFTKPFGINDMIQNVKNALEAQNEKASRAAALARALATARAAP